MCRRWPSLTLILLKCVAEMLQCVAVYCSAPGTLYLCSRVARVSSSTIAIGRKREVSFMSVLRWVWCHFWCFMLVGVNAHTCKARAGRGGGGVWEAVAVVEYVLLPCRFNLNLIAEEGEDGIWFDWKALKSFPCYLGHVLSCLVPLVLCCPTCLVLPHLLGRFVLCCPTCSVALSCVVPLARSLCMSRTQLLSLAFSRTPSLSLAVCLSLSLSVYTCIYLTLPSGRWPIPSISHYSLNSQEEESHSYRIREWDSAKSHSLKNLRNAHANLVVSEDLE